MNGGGVTIEVRQREYAIGLRGTDSSVLTTENIWTCTGLVGINQQRGAAFLCHLDTPFSVPGLAKLASDLQPYGGLGSFTLFWTTGSPPWMTWVMAFAPGFTRHYIWRKLGRLDTCGSVRPKFLGFSRTWIRCGLSVNADTGQISHESYILPRRYDRFSPPKMSSFGLSKSPGSA